MTAKTTVTIEAVYPDGTDLTNRRVVVQLIHGGAGGTVDGELIAERTTVPLTGAGPWSIALYPTAAISPSGCFYRFTIDNSSPTINRDISVPSSGPVSWTDAAILLENPEPPVTIPAAVSGDPLDVVRVNAEGTAFELAAGGGGTVDVVSNVATSRILGRTTAGTGDSEELTAAAARTLLDVYDTATVTTALGLKAPLASPTFTGTVAGITAAMVGAPSGSGTSTGTNTGDQTLPTLGSLGAAPTGDLPVAASWSGARVAPLGPQGLSASTHASTGYEYWVPVWVPAGTYVAIEVTTTVAQVSTWRLGSYNNHHDFYPVGVDLDAGTVNMNATAGVQPVTISYTYSTSGWRWLSAKITAYTAVPTTQCMYGFTAGGGAQIHGWPGRTNSGGYSGLFASGRGTGALAAAPTFTIANLFDLNPKITLRRA